MLQCLFKVTSKIYSYLLGLFYFTILWMFKKNIEILNKICVERKHLNFIDFFPTNWLAFEGLNAKKYKLSTFSHWKCITISVLLHIWMLHDLVDFICQLLIPTRNYQYFPYEKMNNFNGILILMFITIWYSQKQLFPICCIIYYGIKSTTFNAVTWRFDGLFVGCDHTPVGL